MPDKSKQQQLEQALRRLYAANLIDNFFVAAAQLIAKRDTEAKIAGIQSLRDANTGYIYELEAFEVDEIINNLRNPF